MIFFSIYIYTQYDSLNSLDTRLGMYYYYCMSVKWDYREREMFYLTTHSTHFIYGYMASDTWLRTILIVRKETRCRHIDYSYQLTARVLLYAPSNRQNNTYHGLCYTSPGALAGTRNSGITHQSSGYTRSDQCWLFSIPITSIYISLLLFKPVYDVSVMRTLKKYYLL